jgi:hypothetical protein
MKVNTIWNDELECGLMYGLADLFHFRARRDGIDKTHVRTKEIKKCLGEKLGCGIRNKGKIRIQMSIIMELHIITFQTCLREMSAKRQRGKQEKATDCPIRPVHKHFYPTIPRFSLNIDRALSK